MQRRETPRAWAEGGPREVPWAQWWLLVCYAFAQPPAPLGSGLVGEIRVAAAGKRSDPRRKSEKQGEQEKAWMKQRDLPESLWGDWDQILREKNYFYKVAK